MTIGVLSIPRGDELASDITMIGTIKPDGTVGPVGGIPYEVQGVIAAHKTKDARARRRGSERGGP